MPREVLLLWETFMELNADRGAGLSGPERIPLGAIETWMRVYGVQLTPWEVATLRAMDAAVMGVWAENRRTTGASP